MNTLRLDNIKKTFFKLNLRNKSILKLFSKLIIFFYLFIDMFLIDNFLITVNNHITVRL